MLVRVLVERRSVQARRRIRQGDRSVEVDRARVDLRVLGLDIHFAAAHIEQHATLDARLLVEVHAIITVTIEVFPLTVGLARVGRDRPLHSVADRTAGINAGLVAVVRAIAAAHIERGRIARLAGSDDHRAGHGVTTVKGALRALEDFDLRNAGQFLVQRIRVGLQHAVDDEREVGLRVATGVDAADVDLHIAGFGGLHGRDTRRQGDEVLRALDARRLDFIGGEGGDGHGHVFDALCALTGRDDDFLELRFLRTSLSSGEGRDDGRADQGKLPVAIQHEPSGSVLRSGVGKKTTAVYGGDGRGRNANRGAGPHHVAYLQQMPGFLTSTKRPIRHAGGIGTDKFRHDGPQI